MPRTKPQAKSPRNSANGAAPRPDPGDVLTLAEAAAYLRIAEDDVLRLIRAQGLPGRQVGAEWRLLTSAVQDWLREPPRKSGKDALLAMAGAFKDDPYLDDIVREAYRQRGRPITEEGE